MRVIVDVGLGNAASVRNMFKRLGHELVARTTPDGLDATDTYVVPGVGAFDEGVRRLQASGWFDHLATLPGSTHILGICLGMQLLGRSSQEGSLKGLNRIQADFTKFRDVPNVPHMGWNTVEIFQEDVLFDPTLRGRRYYFSHTFRTACDDPEVIIGQTEYGGAFTSAFRVGNTRGVQFHPEKSHRFGMSLLSRWSEQAC